MGVFSEVFNSAFHCFLNLLIRHGYRLSTINFYTQNTAARLAELAKIPQNSPLGIGLSYTRQYVSGIAILRSIAAVSPEQFATFGDLLKFLRRQAGLTQRELSIAVGYSDTQISRLEQNQRIPDAVMLTAMFVPALHLESEPDWVKRLLALAAVARQNVDASAQSSSATKTSLLGRVGHVQLIGRQSDLQALQALWARTQLGHAHLALISGEPGIGKTRLVREFQAQVKSAGATVLIGGCYEFETAAPYFPVVEALRTWVGAQSELVLRHKIGAMAPELARLVPEIEAHLGPLTASPQLAPHEERLRLFDNLARFFQALANPHGLLIILDDVHWADQGTLALLHYLFRRLREVNVLVVAAYREAELDRAHPLSAALVDWNRERLVTRIALGRFSLTETRALLAALLSEPTISQEFSEAIYHETEGNPFFIEEVVKSLIEQGDVYRGEARWERKAIAELTIPQSIKEAIGRRLNRLSAECVEVLHTAAALGKAFAFERLAATLNLSEDDLLDALDEADAAQLTQAEGGELFAFTHDKIREVLYEELNPIRRRRLHQRIGEGLEKLYAASPTREASAPDMAYHFIQSGDLPRGLKYSLEAAAQAQRWYALEEALRHYQRAAEMAEALGLPDQLTTTYERVADVEYHRGVYLTAADGYQQVFKLIAPDDGARRAVLNRKIGDAYAQVGDERGLQFLQQAERELDPVTQADELALTLTWLGRYHHYHAQHRTAIEFFERARQLAEPQDQVHALFFIYTCLAGAYNHLTQFTESSSWARRAIALGERKEFLPAQAVGYEFLSENALVQGDWAKTLEYAACDRAIGEKIGAFDRVIWADVSRIEAWSGRGELRSALDPALAALTLADQIGEGRVAVLLSSLLARIEADLGYDEAARAHAELGLKHAEQLGQVFTQCVGRHGLAYYHIQRDEWVEAVALYEQCAKLYQPTDNQLARLWLGPYPAVAYLGLGRIDLAIQTINNYLAHAREAQALHKLGAAFGVQGQILSMQGLRAAAAAAFGESIAILDRLGSRLEMGRTFHHRGRMYLASNEVESGRNDLRRALELFKACGAVRDQARAALSLERN